MAEIPLNVLIEAKNNASAPIDATQQAMNRLMESVKAGDAAAQKFFTTLTAGKATTDQLLASYGQLAAKTADLTTAASQLTAAATRTSAALGTNYRDTRLLSGVIAAELTPAIGGAAGAMLRFGTIATLVGSSFGPLGLALAAAAVAVGGLLAAYEAAAKSATDFRLAAEAADVKGVTAGIAEYSKKVRELADSMAQAQKAQASWGASMADMGGEAGAFFGALEYLQGGRRDTAAAELRRRAILQGQLEYGNAITSGEEGVLGVTSAQEAARLGAARGLRGAYDFRLDPLTARYAAQLRGADDMRLAVGTGPRANALIARAQGAAGDEYQLGISALQTPHLDRPGATSFMAEEEAGLAIGRAAVAAIRDEVAKASPAWPGFSPAAIAAYAAGESQTSGEGFNIGAAAGQSIVEAMLQRRRGLLQLQQQGLQVGAGMPGFSANDLDAIRLRELGIRTEELTLRRDLTPEQMAQSQQNLVLERNVIGAVGAARNDPLTGLALGFKAAADAASESGRIMQEFARGTAASMTKEFSDGFFDVITGNFKDLPNVAAAFGKAMVREFTNALAQMVTAPIFRTLSSLGNRAFGIAPAAVGIGAGAGSALLPAGAVMAGPGGVPMVVGGAAPTGYSAGIGGGGIGGLPIGGLLNFAPKGGFFTDLLNTPVASFFNGQVATYGVSAAALAGQINAAGANVLYSAGDIAALQAAGYSAADIAALAGGAEAASGGAGLAGAGAAAGATIGSALGVVGGVIGFGYSLYSAYQMGSPGYGAATGALSGAVLGATIGSIFPGIGTAIGAVVGAIVGAAGGAGAGAAGKQGKTGAQREADETKQAIALANNLAIAVQSATSVEEVLTLLGQYQSGSIGGGQGQGRVAVVTTVTVKGQLKYPVSSATYARLGARAIYPLASRDEFLENIDSLQAGIQAGVNQGNLQGTNQAIAQTIIQKVKRLAAIEQRTFFAFRQSFAAPGVAVGPGAGASFERETFYPLSRLSEAAGQDILVNVDLWKAGGMTDAEAEMVLRRLVQVDSDKNLGFLNVERFTF